MRLAVVVPAWDPVRGGQERYLDGLLPWLETRGVDPLVVTRLSSVPASSRIAVVPPGGLTGGARQAAFAREALRTARRTGAEEVLATFALPGATHVQLHGGLLADAFAAERAALPCGLRKLLFGPAGLLNGRRRTLLALERAALAGPARPRLMVWSRSLAARVARLHGVPQPEVDVATPFVDGSVFRTRQRAQAPGQALRVAFAAHVFALKGLRTVLESLRLLARRGIDASLEVAGRGRPGPFAALARRLGLEGRVRFLGALEPEALADLFRRSDVLAHPTHHDPCSLACLEALACGCPVVTTRANGASERLAPGEDGLVLEAAGDPAALGDALETLAPAAVRTGMREAAAATGARFTLEAHGAHVLRWLGAGA